MQITPFNPAPRDDRQKQYWHEKDHVPVFGTGWRARQLFAHFQNLNLRVLIDDLREDRVASGNWTFARDLCPVAHGVADGRTVSLLQYMSQAVGLERACELAAEHIGASPRTVYHLITLWDAGDLGRERLLHELELIWQERMADAETMQLLLVPQASPQI